MRLDHFSKQLAALESQKNNIEQKIAAIKKEIEKLSPFSRADKIALFP